MVIVVLHGIHALAVPSALCNFPGFVRLANNSNMEGVFLSLESIPNTNFIEGEYFHKFFG